MLDRKRTVFLECLPSWFCPRCHLWAVRKAPAKQRSVQASGQRCVHLHTLSLWNFMEKYSAYLGLKDSLACFEFCHSPGDIDIRSIF